MKKRKTARHITRRKAAHAALSEEFQALLSLHSATFGLAQEKQLRTLLDRVLTTAIEITAADFGNVQLVDPLSGNLQISAHRGLSREFIHFFNELPANEAACGHALTSGERVIVTDVEEHPIFRDWRLRAAMLRSGVHACQSTPLRSSSGHILGVLSTHYRQPGSPPTRGLRLLDLFAREAADLIERALHREELESLIDQRTHELAEKNRALAEQAHQLHELSARLLQAQDAERRRIARELHDSTAQEIAWVAMTLRQLSQQSVGASEDTRTQMNEISDMARKALEELRTVSYLLHPPMLDELGFRSAVLHYASGFEKRSGIRVAVEVPRTIPRLPQEVEVALFRIVQEALTNVHRYSGSQTARIELRANDDEIALTVEDQGKGMAVSAEQQFAPGLGVGIPGMRERLHQFGGALEIESGEHGTRLIATLPGHILSSTAHGATPPAPETDHKQASDAAPTRILIVEDSELTRGGIRSLLQGTADLQICGEASTGEEALRKAASLLPEVITLDLSLPDMSGLGVCLELRRRENPAKILALTVHSSPYLAVCSRQAGCNGFIQKALASRDLLRGIRAVLGGPKFFSPGVNINGKVRSPWKRTPPRVLTFPFLVG